MANIELFNSTLDLKKTLAGEYQRQITNYFGDEKKALKFLSGVVSAVQRNQKLLDCTPASLLNSFMVMAQLELMPSDVSGEAYVIPYINSKKNPTDQWEKITEAQFQLGYQGLVTLFYRAGAKSIIAEIVHAEDEFEILNGEIRHKPHVFSDDRGRAVGAYVIITLGTGGQVSKVMSAREILEIGEKFSKSFNSDYSPWNEKNDPQRWMWRKTVLKQAAKLVPKNERLVQAIAEDNKDSIIIPNHIKIKDENPQLDAPMQPYKVERKIAADDEDETGGVSHLANAMETAEEQAKKEDPKVQRMEIANLLKKHHRYTVLGKTQEDVAAKIMSITGIKYEPINYNAIIKDLKGEVV